MFDTIAAIVAAHRSGSATPERTVAQCFERIRKHGDPGIFIALRDEAEAIAQAKALSSADPDLPLFGVPVAVKDNIDVSGLATTAACPAFSYRPGGDATAVARLIEAGAIVIGKTNLDQFATGLVGTRTPYPIPRNAVRPDLIPGGSSSGSAVAVAAGLVPVALGTDTAGSGRVPAMLNNIVGLKPSLGLVSTHGVVPACRTLDCVSVFALTVDDAWTVLSAVAGHDPLDPYSRRRTTGYLESMPRIRFGVPDRNNRIFFGDETAEADYDAALEQLEQLGASIAEIDMTPLYETARLLYEGPWVAERYAAAQSIIESDPTALHPVTRAIIENGIKPTAVDTFNAFYRLEELRRKAELLFRSVDALVLPTAPGAYSLADVLADPVTLNSRLGTYTNFANLLDMCGLAVPASLRADRTPFGITLLAPAGRDALLASIGRVFHAQTKLPLGASDVRQPPLPRPGNAAAPDEIAIAVVGAHLSGMPLNFELTSLGGRLLRQAKTAADYRLFALADALPKKPGLLRVPEGTGAAIEVEVWALPVEGFGAFVATVPPPLSIGTLRLSDGRSVKGFLAEAEGVAGAQDISKFGGWRAYIKEPPR